MKKIATLILALIMSVVILSGCSNETNNDILKTRFVIIDDNVSVEDIPNGFSNKAYFFADRETGVIYFYINSSYRGAITALLSTDGTPMLYDFENKKIIEER